MSKEATSRIKINKLLEEAGWRFFDDENGPANIVLENNVKISKTKFDSLGNDFEKTTSGYIDFLLLDIKSFPLAVLEAKKEEKNPLDGKEQARRYAQSCNARYIILSNGNLHYLWDLERGNPNLITSFPAQESLQKHKSFSPNPAKLIDELIEPDYIAITQKPDYNTDPRWLNENQKEQFIKDNNLKYLRPYQIKAVQAIQNSVHNGNSRFLFEMATGTGKTLVAAAIAKLFLRTNNASRVLFLVDRIELEDQAWKSFVRYLKNDFSTVIYKQNRSNWKNAEIVVTTIQSLLVDNKFKRLFSPVDFDLVISDEAHRTIGGNSRAVFEYFIGYKLGLTATPKNYLKKLDPAKISRKDPRELERRILLDTYKTFGCESGDPTFRYSLIKGVKDGYLINPIVADARTEITTQLLSDEGYSVLVETDDGKEAKELFFQRDFERKFFSNKTNLIFCKTFIENALKDPLTGETGKTIIFCVSQNHAAKITQILNLLAEKHFPRKYNSDFAVQITSRIKNAQDYTINFSNNNLNGHTNYNSELDAYKSGKTRVCVTVGMMTTGYDCEDILNLCLMRPIFSPTDFIQIKGRGTRTYDFSYKRRSSFGEMVEINIPKERFKLFDFFANCEYFEEKFNYDEILKLPPETAGTHEPYPEPPPPIKEYENLNLDPLKSMEETPIGFKGMKIDRMYFDNFADTVRQQDEVQEYIDIGDFIAAEDFIRNEIFNKPEEFYNLEKLRKAVQVDRRLSLREIIELIFGFIKRFKSKDELLDDEFDKFISIHKPESSDILPIKNFLKAYITDSKVRDIIEKRQFARFATHPISDDFRSLGTKWRKIIPEYVKDYVPLNSFMS